MADAASTFRTSSSESGMERGRLAIGGRLNFKGSDRTRSRFRRERDPRAGDRGGSTLHPDWCILRQVSHEVKSRAATNVKKALRGGDRATPRGGLL